MARKKAIANIADIGARLVTKWLVANQITEISFDRYNKVIKLRREGEEEMTEMDVNEFESSYDAVRERALEIARQRRADLERQIREMETGVI